MKLLILSDIHGNLSAFVQVMERAKKERPDAVVLLGDLIDYGMRSNEVIRMIQNMEFPILCNIWGNHEQAIMNAVFSRFSSERGSSCAKYTQGHLETSSVKYLSEISNKEGYKEFEYGGKKFLAVHGSVEDPFWKSIDIRSNLEGYESYDYVLSGHSHIPHVFSHFYSVEDSKMRNRKKTVFINPGSVGQPRNHDPAAQYAVLDFSSGISFHRVCYDIKFEQSLYPAEIDSFYKERLSFGV